MRGVPSDATALAMCKEQKLPVLVFDFKKSGNIRGVIEGKSIGEPGRTETLRVTPDPAAAIVPGPSDVPLPVRDSAPPSRPRGSWQYGRRQGRAVCSSCREIVRPGAWVTAAPGFGGTVRHVRCGGRR